MEYTKNQVKKIIREKGFEPLDFDWNGYDSFVDFKDVFGYKYSVKWHNFNRDEMKEFKPIINTNPYYFENMKNYLYVNGCKSKIVSTSTPKNNCDKITFVGVCGHEFKRDWTHFVRNNKDYCPKCFRKIQPHRKKLTVSQYKDLFSKYGFEILENLNDGKKRNNDTPIEVKDKYGYKGFLNYSNLQQRKEKCTFMPFSKFNKWSIYNIRHYFSMNNIKTEVISEQYIDYNSKIKFRCSCGREFIQTFPNPRSTFFLCPYCNKSVSKLEQTVENFLKDNNIEYIKQKKFDECKYERCLPFDFYLQDKNICIEVQGEQHYFPIIFGNYSYDKAYSNLLEQQKKDNIKFEYCKNNNIKLITLDYEAIRNGSYVDILKKYLRQKYSKESHNKSQEDLTKSLQE